MIETERGGGGGRAIVLVYDQARFPALVDARIIATLRAALSVGQPGPARPGPVRSVRY